MVGYLFGLNVLGLQDVYQANALCLYGRKKYLENVDLVERANAPYAQTLCSASRMTPKAYPEP